MTIGFVLTAAQRATVTDAARRWERAAVSTQRCDRRRAEVAVRAAYAVAGLAPPSTVIWMDSPVGGVLAANLLREPDLALLRNDTHRHHSQLWQQIARQLGDRPHGSHRSARERLSGPLAEDGGWRWTGIAATYAALHRRETRGLLGDRPGRVGGQVWAWAQRSSGVRWYSDEVFDPAESDVLLADLVLGMIGRPSPRRHARALGAAVAECGPWWPFLDAVVLTDRPTRLHLDGQDRLHHPTGAALAYADGCTGHFWHGLAVPEDLLDPGWSAETILREPNLEVRRAAVDRRHRSSRSGH